MNLEDDDLEQLTSEIRRLIESNKQFLERVVDEDYEDEEAEPEEPGADDFEEL